VPLNGREMKDAYFHNSWEFVDNVIRLWRIKIPQTDVSSGMARFPGRGDFTLGEWLPKEEPEQKTMLASPKRRTVPSFWLDTTEVTNREYKRLKREHNFPPEEQDHPVTSISWEDAVAYAEVYGKRLP